MFEFRKIQLRDRDAVNERLAVSDFRGCEYSFANNMAWQRLNNTLICLYRDFYICCSWDGNDPYITFPAGVKTDETGKEKYIYLFSALKKFFEDQGKKLIVSSVTEENLQWIREYYGDSVTYGSDRDYSDYIYNSSDLINFPGKKYHAKRNHIRRFMENNWFFEPICPANTEECIVFATNFYNSVSASDHSSVIEQYAINLFLTEMEYLGLTGALLKCGKDTVGVTIGERLNSDTFVVHIEKARSDVQGAYPMLCSQFAKKNASELTYINREEDLGIEGLRKSKLSYRPVFLLDKYTVFFK